MKKWIKPELVILFRGAPEERVLGACKDGTDYNGANEEYHTGCWTATGQFVPCNECSWQHVT